LALGPDKGQPRFAKFDQALQQTYSAGVEAFTAPVASALGTTYDFNRHRGCLTWEAAQARCFLLSCGNTPH